MTRRQLVVSAALIALLVMTGVVAGPTLGQTAPPNAYYGAAESTTGTDAPVGTTIVAVANGEVQDSVTVETTGEYGGSDPTADKLRVSSDIDSTVTFHIDGPDGAEAAETDPNPTGEVEQLDLTFPGGTFGGPTPTPTETDTATETETPTETPTETATATETETGTLTETDTATATKTETATPAETATDAVTETATDDARTTESGDTAGSTGDASDGSGSDQSATDGPDAEVSAGATSADTGDDRAQNAALSVTNATLNRTQVPVGGVVAVNATVHNEGNTTATRAVGLTVAGEPVTSRNVTVRADESGSVRFRYRANETGEYPVAVGFASAGTLTVGESGGGLVPWGLLKTVAMSVAGLLVAVYAVLKALAIYLGY
ncbi:hypothetical protein [Haloarcula sp. H-GB5]